MWPCPLCAEPIQDEAIRCRHCRSDLTLKREVVAAQLAGPVRVLTEHTSKRLKAHALASGLLLTCALVWCVVDYGAAGQLSPILGCGAVGALLYRLIVRSLVWWNHG